VPKRELDLLAALIPKNKEQTLLVHAERTKANSTHASICEKRGTRKGAKITQVCSQICSSVSLIKTGWLCAERVGNLPNSEK
jgi:hypothetical protein